jgi:pseudolysin
LFAIKVSAKVRFLPFTHHPSSSYHPFNPHLVFIPAFAYSFFFQTLQFLLTEQYMKNISWKLISLVTLALTSQMAQAAEAVDLSQQPVSLLQALNNTPVEFKETHRNTDLNHTTHIRIQQTYSGFRVWGADAVLHSQDATKNLGDLMSAKEHAYTANGIVYRNLTADLATAPAYIFQPAQADKAFQQTAAHYAVSAGNRNPLTEAQKELLVYVDQQSKAHWAFLISFKSAANQGLPAKPTYLIDAVTFQTYENWNDVKTLDDVDAGGFGGNVKMGKSVYDGLAANLPKLGMERSNTATLCYVENNDVVVKDRRLDNAIITFKCSAVDAQHKVYWDADKDAVNGGYSPANDALYAGKVIKAMYQDWYKIPVLVDQQGNPLRLVMLVHEQEDNAWWDDMAKEMTFGDGIVDFYPLVSLGVAGHEISHGFTSQWSDLVYEKQSGGLNESFSDMAAQAAEYYSAGKNTWQIGAEILKAKDKSLRYMDEPTKDCIGRAGKKCSINNAKDYVPGLDVHYSSGVFNKFFYLLGTTTNWNTRKAFNVMVNANMNYWTSTSTFIQAACGVLSAAKDLKYDTQAVKSAALKVGIDTGSCK